MGRAKTRRFRRQAAFDANKRGLTLLQAKKMLGVGWSELSSALKQLVLISKDKKVLGYVTGFSTGPTTFSINPSGQGAYFVGMDVGFQKEILP